MTEEEKEAFNCLSALEVSSEYEASSKEILLDLIEKQDTEINKLNNVIDRMALELYNYANLGQLGICPAEQENGNYNLDLCKMNLAERNCLICIKEYFMKEDK